MFSLSFIRKNLFGVVYFDSFNTPYGDDEEKEPFKSNRQPIQKLVLCPDGTYRPEEQNITQISPSRPLLCLPLRNSVGAILDINK